MTRVPSCERSGLFTICTDNDVRAIRRAGTEVSVAAGCCIHQSEQPARWAYLMLDGVAVATEDGRCHALRAGDIHGARALLSRDHSCGELIAATDARVLVIDRSHFTALMTSNAAFACGVAKQLATFLPSTGTTPAENPSTSDPTGLSDAA